jgi:hypothetical protein
MADSVSVELTAKPLLDILAKMSTNIIKRLDARLMTEAATNDYVDEKRVPEILKEIVKAEEELAKAEIMEFMTPEVERLWEMSDKHVNASGSILDWEDAEEVDGDGDDDTLYCFCEQPEWARPESTMMGCDGPECKHNGWFHEDCIKKELLKKNWPNKDAKKWSCCDCGGYEKRKKRKQKTAESGKGKRPVGVVKEKGKKKGGRR